MKNIFGSIGYTLLNNKNNILVFADKHDSIPDCVDKINMAEWFKTKFNSSIILLEEIPRVNSKVLELWDQSVHTKELKDVYLQNPSIIKPVDIRHFLLLFSWEVVNDNPEPEYDITLNDYLLLIDEFLSMKNSYLIKNCKLYDAKILMNLDLGRHFLNIKDEFSKLLLNLRRLKLLNTKIKYIIDNHQQYLMNINELISRIMEWYICACICEYNNRSLIIHVGLAHSEQIVSLLQSIYKYKIIEQQGINKLDELSYKEIKGCVQISDKINQQFGGYF
jgi:hypothetical protein